MQGIREKRRVAAWGEQCFRLKVILELKVIRGVYWMLFWGREKSSCIKEYDIIGEI